MAVYAISRRTSALTAVGTSWAAFASDGSWDVTIDAGAGDVIELGISAFWDTGNIYRYADFGTIVSGSVVNWVSTGTSSHTSGVLGLFQAEANDYMPVAGETYYTVQSGDVSSGQVTFRAYGKVASGTKAIYSDASNPAIVWASVVEGDDPVLASVSGTASTSWTAFTGTATINAAAGDVVKVSMDAVVAPGPLLVVDVATIVSGSPVNWVSSASGTHSASVGAWRCAFGVYEPIGGGGILYTVQSGDVSSGQVTFRAYGLTVVNSRSIDSGAFSARKVA